MCACVKNIKSPAPGDNGGDPVPPQNFKSIVTTSSFDWSNTKQVSLAVQGMAVDENEINTLTVKLKDGSVVFQYAMNMNESITSAFVVPSSATQVVISYGAISKTETIVNNSVSFDFITPIPQEYN